MRKPDKSIVCYVTERSALSRSEPSDPLAKIFKNIRATVELEARIGMAAEAGADWIQIREKDLPGRRLLKLTRQFVAAADQAGERSRTRARIYVNDRVDVALAARAAGLDSIAGVHLGGESLPVAEVVRWCRGGNAPAEFEIGVSTHSIEQARAAERDGAEYIFFGPIFDTPSKREFGTPQGIERLGEVCGALRIPVIAIGGINESNAWECIRAGASGVAAIRVFQEAADVGGLAQAVDRMRAAVWRG